MSPHCSGPQTFGVLWNAENYRRSCGVCTDKAFSQRTVIVQFFKLQYGMKSSFCNKLDATRCPFVAMTSLITTYYCGFFIPRRPVLSFFLAFLPFFFLMFFFFAENLTINSFQANASFSS